MAAWVGGSKTPPYSVYSEKALLSGILAHPEVLEEVRSILPDPRVFFREQHAALYEAILELDRRGPDGGGPTAAALTELLTDSGRLAEVGGERFIAELSGEATLPAQTVTHARTVADKAKLRHLINLVSEILSDAYGSGEGYEAVLGRAHERLKDLFGALPQEDAPERKQSRKKKKKRAKETAPASGRGGPARSKGKSKRGPAGPKPRR